MTTPPDSILGTKVLYTIVGGKVVYTGPHAPPQTSR
jgi:predicted amidohydrolase YtcJ